ncbi:transcription antitermination factor NusB [Nakamurella deserti]|uniref:transcription antitermination factor NusB n=1 Tax=Nakamurella deserti TaxID=2164074 RepID=UPI000DBE8ADD|nr:transcription antitermination factor NusB [Nakamurella deserti]
MSARSKARKRALDVVFAADARNVDPVTLLTEREETGELTPMGEYAEQIVRGVATHYQRIDGLLAEHSQGWELHRMPAVDLAVLRIAAWELLYSDVPGPVIVDEAVELAKSLSTDNSPRFVNGVLGRLMGIAGKLRTAPN